MYRYDVCKRRIIEVTMIGVVNTPVGYREP